MLRKSIVCLVVTMLVVGFAPGISALELPTEGPPPDTVRASDAPASLGICAQSNETLTVDAGADFQTSKDETIRFVADLDPDDADNRVSSYEWRDESGNQNKGKRKGKNAGQGPSGQVLSTQKSFETQLKAGKHTITLTVETTNGRTLTDTVNVTVRGNGKGAETNSPPEADAGDCRMVIADEETRLDGSGSYDRDGTIESYDWDVDGDDTIDVTGETPTVRFDELGNRSVALTVTDDGGNTDTDTVNLFVNDRPLAAFDYAPTRPNPNESVTFDAGVASDDLGGIDAYRWDFDGDGTFDATGETVAHAFTTPGNYTVTLAVTDAYGVRNTTTTTVHVNRPPTANASESDRRANVSESITLDGTASTDPEGEIASYEWDVDGDGEFEITGANVSHAFETTGDKTVTLRVTDDGGLTDTDTISIRVNNPPTARIDASNQTVVVGESVTFDGSSSTDADGDIVRYEWDVDGDGETDATGPTVEHAPSTAGTYTAELTVTDDDGATDTATRTIAVLPDQIDEEPPGLPGPPENPDAGSGTGDPHLTTFDGRNYDFQAEGEFVMAREPNGSLSVQARLDPVSHRPVSVIEAVATSLDGHNVTLDSADATPLVVDGERRSLNQTDRLNVGDGAVFRRGSTYVVVYPGDDSEVDTGDERLTLRHRGDRLDLWLTLQDDRTRPIEGLLGTPAEEDPDIALANGTAVSRSDYGALYGPFRADWRVDSLAESHFHYETGESPDSFYNPDYPSQLVTVDDLSDDERSAAEQAAREAGLEPGTAAYRNAVLDYALTNDESYLESALTSHPANATFGIEAGSSFAASANDSVTFVATIDNESASDVNVEWRFGDGESATGTQVTHAYDATGTYTVTATATGPNGGIARDTLAVTVGENVTTDQPPVARVETTRLNGTHVRLDATASVDPDGTLAGYAWNIDDDAEVDSHASTVTVPLASNPIEVSVVVLDDDGNQATETVELPPLNDGSTAATVSANRTIVHSGGVVAFDASDSEGVGLSYVWEFGDGATATGPTVTHAFDEPGTYSVEVRATDASGETTTATSRIVVLADSRQDSFEEGLGKWSIYDDGFGRRGASIDGEYSAGDYDGSAQELQARWQAYEGGDKPRKFSFYYRETSDSNGGGVRVKNSDGETEVGFATDNPQWKVYDADGTTRLYGGDGYGRWVYVEFTFDWENDEYVVYVEDQASGSSRIYTGELRSGTDVESVEIANWAGSWNSGSSFDMWIDDVSFEDVDTNDPRPDPAATATRKRGDNYRLADVNSSSNDRSYVWEFGDGLLESGDAVPVHRYERPGTYTAKVSVRNEYGLVNRDTVTLRVNRTDDYLDSFEHGLRTWNVKDGGFGRRGASIDGEYSAGDYDGSAQELQAKDTVYPGGDKPRKFSFYYRETSDSNGGGVRVKNSDGETEVGFATDNPQWKVYDADGTTRLYGGDGYGRWVYVEFTFDWENDEYIVYVEDQVSGSSRMYTGELREGTDVESVEVANWAGSWNSGSSFDMWVDDVSFQSSTPDESWPNVEATATHERGDIVGLANATDSQSDQRTYFWEFGDGLKQEAATPSHKYERPGTYTAKVSVRDDRGRVSRDTVTFSIDPTDDYRESFEHGLRTWNVKDGGFGRRSASIHGEYSAGDYDSSAQELQARDTVYPGGHKPQTFSFYYRETSDSNGGGVRVKNSNGETEVGFATDNPQWKVYDADGTTQLYGGDGYGRWVYVEFTFDWENDTYTVYVEDQASDSSRTYSGELRSGTGVESVEIANWAGSWNSGSSFDMWIDDITFTSRDETTTNSTA